MTPYWSHFLTLYRSNSLAQYRGYFLTFLKAIFWPCTEVIIWPWINRGHILTLLRSNFVTLNIFTALRSFSDRSTLKEAFFWCFMYQRPFCDPVQRSFSDLFYEGFFDDFHWLLIPLTTFCVVLGHVAVIWSREPPPSLIYNDRSRSFLLYIWYTQRSTTQPINIQGKFNPLNNTKYRIIISSSMSLVNPKRSEIVSWCRKSRSNAVHVLLLINNIHRHVTKVNIHLPAHQKKFKLWILNNLRGVSFPCFHRCMRS